MNFSLFFKDMKAQSALESLLMLIGIILISAIVIAVLVTNSEKGTDDANKAFDDFNQIKNNLRS
jgi:uncharacterized protein (UPF0333 family)